MLLSIEKARILSKLWLAIGYLNACALFVFLNIMLQVPAGYDLLLILGIATGVGLLPILHVTYRAKFTSQYAICALAYFLITFEIIFFGSGAALAMELAGRSDLRWLAFNTNVVCLALVLLISVFLQARDAGFWNETDRWHEEIEKYIDYSTRQVDPLLTDTYKPKLTFKHPSLIMAAGAANIPLLFQMYGGGKANAIFLAAPVGVVTLAYINYKICAPVLLRLLLLRKIEKEVGYRFQNADYEKIQEVRRGFFFARWLMKDYRPPQPGAANSMSSEQRLTKKQKRKHRR